MRRHIRAVILTAAAAALCGCSMLGFGEDDERQGPPPALFPEAGFEDDALFDDDGNFVDAEPEPAFIQPAPAFDAGPPQEFSAESESFLTGDFAQFDEPAGAPPPLDMRMIDEPGPSQPTFTPPAGLPSQVAAAPARDPRAHAAYLGFVAQRAEAEAYFDWLWMTHAPRLAGAQPYVSAAPDPESGANSVHLYAVNITAAQAASLCAALGATQTPCETIAR
ncbi:MAG: hypothetical protein AAF684_02515 [Pseudomonadota bacterium]